MKTIKSKNFLIKNKFIVAIALFGLLGAGYLIATRAAAPPVPSGYKEIFLDDFNGTSLNTSSWSVVTGTEGHSQSYYQTNNVFLRNGDAVLRTRRHCVNATTDALNDTNASTAACPAGKITVYSSGHIRTGYTLPQEEFQQQLRANTDFAMDYINRLSLNQIYQIDRIVYQGEKGIRTKCIKWILFMSRYYGEPIAKNQCRIYVPLTQDIAANFLHATRESVSSIMRKLTKKGLITSKNKYLTIMDYEGLKNELADSIKNS